MLFHIRDFFSRNIVLADKKSLQFHFALENNKYIFHVIIAKFLLELEKILIPWNSTNSTVVRGKAQVVLTEIINLINQSFPGQAQASLTTMVSNFQSPVVRTFTVLSSGIYAFITWLGFTAYSKWWETDSGIWSPRSLFFLMSACRFTVRILPTYYLLNQ
jgi:hypothetical protein